MPTRIKRPSILARLAVTVALVGFQAYLGYHFFSGTFGTESQQEMLAEMEILKARQASLAAEIESYRHRIALFNPNRMDPDILTERARALLGMVRPDEIIVVPDSGS